MIAGVHLQPLNLGPLSLRPLTEPDATAAASLSAAVGWNQDLADWQRLIALHPEGSLGAWRETELVGTATLVSYGGRVAWLGMVIVAPDERGKGLGGALVDAALASGVLPEGIPEGRPQRSHVGLDATEFGAPLYERRGFREVALVDRWAGVIAPGGSSAVVSGAVRSACAADSERLASFDEAVTSVDRSRLLERFLVEPGTHVVVMEVGSEIRGYGVARSGRTRSHVGPLVVRDDSALGPVVSALAEHMANAAVFLDAVRLPARTSYLESLGLSVSRSLLRMARPAEPVMCGDRIVAATGFEWG